MLAAGFNTKESTIIANYAAGLVIGKHGTETISYKDFLR